VQYEDGTTVVITGRLYLDTPKNRDLLAEIETGYKRVSDIDKVITGTKQYLAQFENPEPEVPKP